MTHMRRLLRWVGAALHANLIRLGCHSGQHRRRVRRPRRREPHQPRMRRAGAWAGRGLAVLGLVAVVWSVWQANLWALLAAAGGFLAATGLALAPLVRVWLAERPATRPSDFAHTIDLLRRAHGALVGWVVGLEEGDVEVTVRDDVSRDTPGQGPE